MNERTYLGMVAASGCCLCRYLGLPPSPATIHHPREGEGMGQRASHFLAIPLCAEHHQGDSGWHGLGKRAFYARYRLDELDLLAMTIACVLGDPSKPVALSAPVKPSRPIRARPLRSQKPDRPEPSSELPRILPRRCA